MCCMDPELVSPSSGQGQQKSNMMSSMRHVNSTSYEPREYSFTYKVS